MRDEVLVSCKHCNAEMVRLGRQLYPQFPEGWLEAWVCSAPSCPSYVIRSSGGTEGWWPKQTLIDGEACALIRGALAYKKLM